MYRLLGRLETGDLSELYRADFDGQSVIVKLFHMKTSDAAYARVVADTARQLKTINHRGIAHVHRVGLTRNRLAIVREDFGRYTLGQVLTRLNTREVLLPPAVALTLIIELLEVLGAAHHVGVLHGAMTPGNVLLADDGTIGLADFGALTALQASPSLRRAFATKGRSAYRAPELSGTEPPSVASDLYALGALLYELLTLREASSGNGAVSTRREKIVAPSRLVRRLNSRIDPIVMRALETEPSRRFRSSAELASALREYLFNNGGVPTRDDVRKFVDTLFPKDVAIGGAMGPVPFELFEVDDITGVLEIQGELSEVAVRPSFSPAAKTDPEVSAIETWHAPEGPRPVVVEREPSRMRAIETPLLPPPEPMQIARPTQVDQPAIEDTLEMKVPPTRRMFAFPFAAATDDENPVMGPTPRIIRLAVGLITLGGAALILYWATRPPGAIDPAESCYQAPVTKSSAVLTLTGAPSDSTVQIDGVRLCPSTYTRVAVAPGPRMLRVIQPSGKVFEMAVRFEAGKVSKVNAVFQ